MVCPKPGLRMPIICTPEELVGAWHHEVKTAPEMSWTSIKNGPSLRSTEPLFSVFDRCDASFVRPAFSAHTIARVPNQAYDR